MIFVVMVTVICMLVVVVIDNGGILIKYTLTVCTLKGDVVEDPQ